MIPQKFIEFIEEIVTVGDYEYGDGSSMTEDARTALAEIQRWHDLATIMSNINYFCSCRYFRPDPDITAVVCVSCSKPLYQGELMTPWVT